MAGGAAFCYPHFVLDATRPAESWKGQPNALRNTTQSRMSAADLAAVTLSIRRICSPSE
jgi:hypothetical protein